MEKTILIAGKDSPAGNEFAEGFLLASRNVLLTSAHEVPVDSENQNQDSSDTNKIILEEWNRSSSLSARSLVLQTETNFSRIDEAVLIFDKEQHAADATKMNAAESSRISGDLISGYQYLALELLNRFEKKNTAAEQNSRLIFIIEECPTVSDCIKTPALRNGTKSIASPLVAAAGAAFVSFAENIAAVYADKPYVSIYLVKCDHDDFSGSDKSLAKWLADYLDNADEGKHKQNSKKSIQWIKAGAKTGGFSFFR